MSDEKREAHNLYVQYLAVSADNAGTTDPAVLHQLHETRNHVTVLVLQFLCQCRPTERFRHPEFPKLMVSSARVPGFEAAKAVEAFYNLEQYLLLLCLMPWKQEYHKIKKYGGFYQSKIESHLQGAESIFRLVGFTERVSNVLLLTHATKADSLQYIAFECLCAAIECKIINDIWHRTRGRQIHIADVVNIRLHTAGSTEIVVSFIESKYSVARPALNVIDGSKRPEENKTAKSGSPTEPFRNKLNEYMKTVEQMSSGKDTDPDIPFMDDDTKEQDLTPGDLDDHLLASLQMVSGKEASPVSNDQDSGLRPSQEWSFVREGLERNYGKRYFDGPRKDLLSGEKEIETLNILNKSPLGNVATSGTGQVQYRQGTIPAEAPASAFAAKTFPPKIISNDSAYASAAPIYPPNYVDMQGSMVPPRHDSEIVKRGSSGSQFVSKTSKSKTEPILRRPADLDPASALHSSYPLADTGKTDSMKKFSKRSSVPVIPKENLGQAAMSTSQHSSSSSSAPVKSIPPMYSRSDSIPGSLGANVKDGSINIHINGTTSNVHTNIKQQPGAVTVNVNSNLNQTTAQPTWTCTFCTYANTNNDVICMMCSKTREVPEIDSPAAGTQLRVCAKCTLENPPNTTECTACGHQLNNTQTIV